MDFQGEKVEENHKSSSFYILPPTFCLSALYLVTHICYNIA